MASKAMASTALLLALNLLFFTLAASSSCPTPSTPKKPTPKPSPKPPTTPAAPKTSPTTPAAPKSTPTTPAAPKSTPTTPAAPAVTYCPIDTLKLGTCANVLGLINLQLGAPPTESCCSLLSGLADAEAAVCLCTALKANVLGINLNIPINLSLLVNYCGKSVPTGFVCGP